MPDPPPDEITRLVRELAGPPSHDLEDNLLHFVYARLHAIAERLMAKERPDHTFQPTMLVHDAWVRLMEQQRTTWRDGRHFLSMAAILMRRILVNHAEARRAQKRAGSHGREELESIVSFYEERRIDLIELDEALERLAETDELASRVVELRFFAGLEVAEVSELLEVPKRTVERAWTKARLRLQRELGGA